MKRLLREPLLHFLLIGALLFGLYELALPGRSDGPRASKEIRLSLDEIAQLTLLYQSQWRRPPTPQELAAPGREQGPAGDPLPRGARDGPRQGRRDRQAPHGAEDAVPGRGRGRRARADDRRAQELVREEQRQVRAAAAAELPASVLLARPARRPRARRCAAGAGEARRPAGRREDREVRSPTRSCSRTTTATARRSFSARNSGRSSRWRSPSFRPARGRGRSSPASAGTWCSSTP